MLMKQIIKPLLISVAFLCAGGIATAQNAPIREGKTTTIKAIEEADTRMAQMSTRISDLESMIMKLTNRMENLEYRLAQSEKEAAESKKYATALKSQLDRLEGKHEALTKRVDAQKSVVTIDPQDPKVDDTTDTIDNKTNNGPQDLRGNSVKRTTTIINSDGTKTIITSDDTQTNDGGFGTLPIDKLPGDAGALFMLGKTRLLDRNYKGAASAFSAYERDFPEGEQIGAARYWMGEALYNQDDFAGSADYFTKVLRFHKDLPSYNDAFHKLARSLRKLDNPTKACALLAQMDGRDDLDKSTRQRIINEKKEAGCQ